MIYWSGSHQAGPDSISVTLRAGTNDNLSRILTPVIWEAKNNAAQIRFRREDSHSWVDVQPLEFSWMAAWRFR